VARAGSFCCKHEGVWMQRRLFLLLSKVLFLPHDSRCASAWKARVPRSASRRSTRILRGTGQAQVLYALAYYTPAMPRAAALALALAVSLAVENMSFINGADDFAWDVEVHGPRPSRA
jgi:hypothetical protein